MTIDDTISMNFNFFPDKNLAQVLTLTPAGTILWYKGMPHSELLTFEPAGFEMLHDSLGGNCGLPADAVMANIKHFLNDFLKNSPRDFNRDGPIMITEEIAKSLLGVI